MNTDFNALITATDKDAQYDEQAKLLLSKKIVLAHILKYTIDEFRSMEPEEITYLIEGEPFISKIPVDPGYTNTKTTKQGGKIIGFNTENQELNEGLVRFDIIFYVRMRKGLSRIIVNVEAQKDEPSEYFILNRSIFYGCRMISSQKEREFIKKDYNDIRQVYSIWVCMNMDENSLNHIHLTDDSIIGHQKWKGNLNLLNIVMIGLTKELPPKEVKYKLHRFLGSLLSSKLSVVDKLQILGGEFGIPTKGDIGKEVESMCNLSMAVKEEGWREGLAEGHAKGLAEGLAIIILNMFRKGFTVEQIADIADKTEAEIESIIKSRQSPYS